MAIDVTVTRTIGRSPREVMAYLADAAHDPEWIGGLIEVHPPDGPLAVGTQVERVAGFMRRRIEYVLEVVALEPERHIAMRSIRAPFPMEVTYEAAPADAGSLVSLRVQGGPGGLARMLHPLMARQMRGNLSGDLARLAARLEQ
ncbi:MAG: SRPBCC family protein [Chloroflexi bacterium]|nr:SRPBCC family protein [Chloroflexota bacterium]MDA1003175.1 SRPBCC family protein [Chloroflexota bacterium]MQC27744.1 hypothetical protein [Chloroflexota bacterium]